MQRLSKIKITQKQYSLVTIIAIFLMQLFYMAQWAKSYDMSQDSAYYKNNKTKHPFYYQLIGCAILALAYLILIYYTYNFEKNGDQLTAKVSIRFIFILMLIGQIITFCGLRGDFLFFITYSGTSTVINNILIFMITLPILYFGLYNENQEVSFQDQQSASLFGAFLIQLMQTLISSQALLDILEQGSETFGAYILISGYIILIVCNYLEYNFTKKIVVFTKTMMAIGLLLHFIGMGNSISKIEKEKQYLYVLEGFIPLFLYSIALFCSTFKNRIEINQQQNTNPPIHQIVP